MPSGEGPGDVPIPPTCAKAEPQPRRAAAMVAITKRVIIGQPHFALKFVVRCPAGQLGNPPGQPDKIV
jgi:hypothetical protein